LGAGPSGSASGHRAHWRLRAEQGRAASGALDGRALPASSGASEARGLMATTRPERVSAVLRCTSSRTVETFGYRNLQLNPVPIIVRQNRILLLLWHRVT